ncbi:MAG: DNA repair protein RadA [Alphaproteobacteria bacterium]|nr:DNA repair protein RadA [Alphaproteobacteria bacterium]
MAKPERFFYCTECGAKYPKWLGKCEDCGQWNTIVEDIRNSISHSTYGGYRSGSTTTATVEFNDLICSSEKVDRILTDIPEFDRVLGGGAVPGSVVLIGGDPGIGKSTLLLQVLASLSQNNNCVYISGEESAEQICLRASRIGVNSSSVKLACETNIDAIINSLSKVDFLVIDSIQTLQSQSVDSIPGTVTQVRTVAYELINFAKTTGTTVFLIGHVTKEGAIAGPKILEHMVDTVLYFEGERGNSYRILRAVKNRYGPCDELGIFEMRGQGLFSVSNPSVLFLRQRDNDVPGATVFSGIEGTRPLLAEVQALVSKSYFTAARRTVVGWDLNRLFTILAVIETKCKISFSDRDVYLNIAGGLKVSEPACDLAVAACLLSARSGCAISNDTCVFGEIGLTGEIRSVARCSERVKEAQKLGFKNIILPASNKFADDSHSANIMSVKNLFDVIEILGMSRHHD